MLPFGATLGLLVLHFVTIIAGMAGVPSNDQKANRIAQELSMICRNPRGFTCDINAAGTHRYMRRPFNRMAFNVVVDVLAYAKDRAGQDGPPLPANVTILPPNLHFRLICGFHEHKHAPNMVGAPISAALLNSINDGLVGVCQPSLIGPGGLARGNTQTELSDVAEMQECPCYNTALACNAAVPSAGGGCLWAGAGANQGCVPANARWDYGRDAPGYNNMAGVWRRPGDGPGPAAITYVPMPAGGGPGRDGFIARPSNLIFPGGGGVGNNAPLPPPAPIVPAPAPAGQLPARRSSRPNFGQRGNVFTP